ncbi:MAG: hypothetical protein P8Y10_11440, partial [Gemmatimonadales bacterium]
MKLRHIVTAVAVISLPACGSDDISGPGGNDADLVGSYELTSIDGDALPVTVFETIGQRVEVVDGNLSISADGSYVLDAEVLVTTDGQSETVDDSTPGSWTLTGNLLTLDSDLAGLCTDTGTWSGDRI